MEKLELNNIVEFKRSGAPSSSVQLSESNEKFWQEICDSAKVEFKKIGWGDGFSNAFLSYFRVIYLSLIPETIILPAIPEGLEDSEQMQKITDEAMDKLAAHFTKIVIESYQREMMHVKNRLNQLKPM